MKNEKKSIPQPMKYSPYPSMCAIFTPFLIIGVLIFSEVFLQWVKQIGWTGNEFHNLSNPGLISPYGLETISAMTFDSEGTLWVGNNHGVFALTPGGSRKIYSAPDIELKTKGVYAGVSALAVDHQNRVWVGTRYGLVVLTAPGYTWEPVLNERVLALATDLQGQLWVGTEKGLSLLSDGKWTHFTPKLSELSRYYFSALFVDQQGQVWTSHFDQIYILTPDGNKIKTFARPGAPYKNDSISSLTIDRQGRVWIGTINGLFVCNNEICARYNARNSGLAEDTDPYSGVYALAFDRDNRLWISTLHDLRILDLNRALPGFLVQGLVALRWLENIILLFIAYHYVARQLSNNALIGALGGGLTSLIVGVYLFFSLPTFIFVMIGIGLVMGLVAGFIGGKIGGKIVAYISGGVAALAIFLCLLLLMSPV